MKTHRGLAKQSGAQQQRPTTYVTETKNRGGRSDSEVLQWLDKSYPPRTKEHAAKSTLLPTEPRCTETEADRKAAGSTSRREKDNSSKNGDRSKPEAAGIQGTTCTRTTNERERNETRSRRRLYRDVLANTAVNHAMLENVFEKRFDELEQQAMEQYRTSEESLALKYQELERQAMEQYRCSGNAPEESTVSRVPPPADKDIETDPTRASKDANCLDGRKCSGFGRCSPVNVDEKDTFPQQQVNFAQTDNRSETGTPGRTPTDKYARSAIVSKSLTTLSQKISYGSKNTSKGASGDRINRNVSVRASSKRRLILVSPYEKESEAKLTRTTDLEEFYCIAQANRNIFGYYNNSKIGKIGGGDENITIIQSPRTEVWLSGFWTT
ncbi:PREDICTED: uncharacterized protein LOC107190927 [Dufourea novaeangliae]|nr:PREDICTED: uncharacterized protein LOC107190927 [Dufourea novaeangliae]